MTTGPVTVDAGPLQREGCVITGAAGSVGREAAVVFARHYTRLDGGQVTLPCCSVFVFRDGLVCEYRSYIDIAPRIRVAPSGGLHHEPNRLQTADRHPCGS